MKNFIQVTLIENKQPLYIAINSIQSIRQISANVSVIMGGGHNNGGWKVLESMDEIIELIENHNS